MSFIKVRDQFNNPPSAAGRLDVALTPQGFTTPQDRRFTDNEGNVSFTGCNLVWPDAQGAFTLEVNTANVNPGYGTALYHTDDIEAAPITITVPKKDGGGGGGNGGGIHCPIAHDKAQFTSWFWDVATRLNATICNNANMIKMVPELEKCGMVWQNQKVYTPDKWRPRIFQPPLNPPNYDSQWFVDCGDFGSEWVLTFRY